MSLWVYVCTNIAAVTSPAVSGAPSSVTAVCSSGAWTEVPPPLLMNSTVFAHLAKVTVFSFLAAYAVRVIVRLIWRP